MAFGVVKMSDMPRGRGVLASEDSFIQENSLCEKDQQRRKISSFFDNLPIYFF
jgi:hypothetical protein